MDLSVELSELRQRIESLEAIISEHEKHFVAQNGVIANQSEMIKTQADMIETQTKLIASKDAMIKFYEEQFALSQRRQFGSSSEQTPDQLRFENLFNEAEALADPSIPEPVIEEITYKRKKRVGKREDDLSGLPVERTDYELSESERICPECGDVMGDIGVTVRNELEIIPAKVINREHAVHAYGCSDCEKNGKQRQIIRADAATPLISGSLASPTAVAHIATQKYVNGIPLYRQEKGFTFDGVVISRQNMANWLIYCSQNYLVAIYSLLKSHLLNEAVLHADETTVQVLKEPERSAKTKSYEWLYRTSGCAEHQIVIYEYQKTRKQDHPEDFLKGFEGYLHTDGYQVYHGLPSSITVVGCWSHCRRYWEKLYESIKPAASRDGTDAERGLVYINLLFAFEHEYADLSPEERLKRRIKQSKPVSDDFFKWVKTIHTAPKTLLGEAVNYSLSQREYLENIYLDGRLEISNNRAERALRPFVQGRKQWLFSNTPNGAESSSVYYSLIETAKENNLNPYQYIKYLLEKLPSAKTSDLDTLLPWSHGIPDYCKIPVKASNIKTEKPMYSSKKGPLHNALKKLRERYEINDSV